MKGPTITKLVITFFILGILAYDVFAYINFGQEGTVSWVTFQLSHDFPIFTFFTGFCMGHLFWRLRSPKEVEEGKQTSTEKS